MGLAAPRLKPRLGRRPRSPRQGPRLHRRDKGRTGRSRPPQRRHPRLRPYRRRTRSSAPWRKKRRSQWRYQQKGKGKRRVGPGRWCQKGRRRIRLGLGIRACRRPQQPRQAVCQKAQEKEEEEKPARQECKPRQGSRSIPLGRQERPSRLQVWQERKEEPPQDRHLDPGCLSSDTGDMTQRSANGGNKNKKNNKNNKKK